jgi:hypothetical protein
MAPTAERKPDRERIEPGRMWAAALRRRAVKNRSGGDVQVAGCWMVGSSTPL